jgi:hypothetical protein
MKLKRRFYDSKVNFKNITHERLILGIVIGLASAFTIYSFFYVVRETFRVMSGGIRYSQFIYIVSETNRNFYNLFFASMSLIFGSSIAINFILSKPQNIFSRHDLKRSRILNDQIFLNFNFVYWFGKMGMLFGALSMCGMDFHFLPYFFIPFTLLIIVMYLETWKTLTRVLGIKGYKWLLIHFLILCVLTFGLSRVDVIDYKAIDNTFLKNNPIVNLPYSDFYNSKNERRDMIIEFKLKVEGKNRLVITTEDKRSISMEDIPKEIYSARAYRREELIPFLKVRLSADKNIDLIHIKKLEAILWSVNQFTVIYDVTTDDIYSNRFENRGIFKRITESNFNFALNEEFPLPPSPPAFDTYVHKDTLKVTIDKEFSIDGIVIPKNMLVRKFKNYINQNTLIEYYLKRDTKYHDYITVLSAHFKVAYELREKEQTIFKEYEYEYNEAYNEEQHHLKEKFPIIIKEKFD